MTFQTINEAYLSVLNDVLQNHEYKVGPRGLATMEKTNYLFTVEHPSEDAIVTKDPERNKKIESYLSHEKVLYNSGTNKAEDFATASKFWLKIANPDGTINSAYGHLLWKMQDHGGTTTWDWAKSRLLKDRDTRQAIIRFNRPEHSWDGNKDFVCTLVGVFHIRDNKLHLCISMRSNDLFTGAVYDWSFFAGLIFRMRDELDIAEISIGSLTMFIHSLHIYEKDVESIKKMLGSINNAV